MITTPLKGEALKEFKEQIVDEVSRLVEGCVDIQDILKAQNDCRIVDILETALHFIFETDPARINLALAVCAKNIAWPTKHVFSTVRLALTGEREGMKVSEIIKILGPRESHERLVSAINLFNPLEKES